MFCSRFSFFQQENPLKVPRNSLRNVHGKLGGSNGPKPSFPHKKISSLVSRFFLPFSFFAIFLFFSYSFYCNFTICLLKRDIANNAARYVGLSVVDSRIRLL